MNALNRRTFFVMFVSMVVFPGMNIIRFKRNAKIPHPKDLVQTYESHTACTCWTRPVNLLAEHVMVFDWDLAGLS